MSITSKVVRNAKLKNVVGFSVSIQRNCSFKSTLKDVDIPRTTIVEYVTKDFGRWETITAIECVVTGRKYTFAELQTNGIKLANHLKNTCSLQNGDVVAFILPNVPEYPICIFGALYGGLQITTVNPNYTAAEIQYQLKDVDVKAIITLGENVANVQQAVALTKRRIPIIGIHQMPGDIIQSDVTTFQDIINRNIGGFSENLSNPEDVVVLPYSSGTTGLPKGVALTNLNIVSNITQFLSPNYEFVEEATENHQDVLPAILPMFHIYGFTLQTLALLKKGCKIMTLPKFDPYVYLNTIVNHKANLLMVAPPVVIFLNNHKSVEKKHLKNIHAIMCGAAPLGGTDELTFREKVGKPVQVYQGFGMTETSPAILMVPANMQGKCHGSVGQPFPNTEVKVIGINDKDGKHLGPNETGELLVKGPQVMNNYHNRPKESKDAFLDGWFRTGDLVYYDENGMFFVRDRIKELIKVNAYQVAPAELEEAIRKFPDIAEAAVIGIPHAISGEVPRAYVVPKQGRSVDVDKLHDFLKGILAPYKQLKGGVAVVDMIPKNPSGKILRRQLKDKFLEKGK